MNTAEKNIVLIGIRGSGKTTVGIILAGRLHREFIPMDALIVYEAGMIIPQIVETGGWERFREIEAQVTQKVARLRGTINATGGGVVLNPANVKALRETGIVFWLNVSVDNSLQRIGEDPNRPSLTGKTSRRDDMVATFAEREAFYRDAAHHIIETDGKTQEQIAEEIANILQEEF
ncbi:shikimate kinase [candidate division KSB3 bacterium]|uniref:Shikimate kinase n=1 Tax=candidate division KSB3 bacterium TaxID=2044937 RepID=A0A2G6KKC7_9BACT|nr:MAG: shikimate kinase [candidate division KSB3 bacterium]